MKSVVKPLTVLLLLLAPSLAGATVRKEGNWPAHEKKIDLEFDGSPNEGLKALAKEADWSLVVSKSVAMGASDVHIAVDDQPADAVLEALFVDSNVVATRNGSLITVTTASGAPPPPPAPADSAAAVPPVPPLPAVPPVPPVPSARGEDKSVVGHSFTLEKDQVVHDLEVTGGSATIKGTVTGDLFVAGGHVEIEEGGHVVGDAATMGGSIHLAKGARVDGDLAAVGGSVDKEEGAIVGGTETAKGSSKGKHKHHDHGSTGSGEEHVGKLQEIGQTISKMAMLFVFGCVLLALVTRRMDTLRVEAAARPMRSFALGIVSSICAFFTLCVMCITIIGIPFAIVLLLAAIVATYGAIAAVLTTFGAAVIGHKSTSPYVHLLVGCGAFLVLLPIPFVGGIVAFVVTMIAIGTLISTRVGTGAKVTQPQLV